MLSQVCPIACRPILATPVKSLDSGSYNVLRRAASTSAAARQRLRASLRKGPPLDEFVHKATSLARKRDQGRLHALDQASQDIPTFQTVMRSHQKWPLMRENPSTLQINIGKLCNLTCRHCHVESGPTKRRENMDLQTINRCLELLEASPSISTVDITGGAPELNPYFRTLVQEARSMGKEVIDRCNIVVLFEEGQDDLPQFLAEQNVNIVASLPCYSPENTDRQRGKRVFEDSILGLQILNQHGFGHRKASTSNTEARRLDLVYNPSGPMLPPPQRRLEEQYRNILRSEHGIYFNNLYTITNMPIKRFADDLLQQGQFAAYMGLLAESFNPKTVEGLMCRHTVNVAWDGRIYDCDFNSALNMGAGRSTGLEDTDLNIWDIRSFRDLEVGRIRTAKHCFGCTAGSGSSCGGALTP